MIQHFLEERFHKAVRFFSSLTAKDLDVRGNVKIDGGLTVGGVDPARPYKVYTALLTQSGTAAPVATVLENTLGGTVVWSRNDVGTYVATLSGAFTANKTFFLTSGATLTDDTNEIIFLSAYWVNSNSIHLYVHDFLGDTIDGKLVEEGSPLLEIRVYE